MLYNKLSYFCIKIYDYKIPLYNYIGNNQKARIKRADLNNQLKAFI